MEQIGSNWMNFCGIWYLSIFQKSVDKIQVSLKSDKNNGYFTWWPIHFGSYFTHFFLEWEMFQTNTVQKIETHILSSITFFKNRAVYEIMWKKLYSRAGHRWQYDTCTLITGYLSLQIQIRNTYHFSTATITVQMHVSITLHIHYPFCLTTLLVVFLLSILLLVSEIKSMDIQTCVMQEQQWNSFQRIKHKYNEKMAFGEITG